MPSFMVIYPHIDWKWSGGMKRLLHIKMTTTRIIVLGFLIGILLGGFLLWLPVSSKAGQDISFVDALFVATTSLCVTGLTPVVMAEQWNYFGQAVILFLMQFVLLQNINLKNTIYKDIFLSH